MTSGGLTHRRPRPAAVERSTTTNYIQTLRKIEALNNCTGHRVPGPDVRSIRAVKQDTQLAHLSGPNGAFIEFGIRQYEFPSMGPGEDWHDRNWLVVQFRVSDGERRWSRSESSWQTADLPRLSAWLRQVADGRSPGYEWTALEPLLTLTCDQASPEVLLTAELQLELRSERAKISM